MTSTNINYVDTYFESCILTKINDEPTYETLKSIKNQLKSNVCIVTSDLGGGTHGHLGMIMTSAEYATISLVPYIHPMHQSAFKTPSGTAQHKAKRLRTHHREFI